jgi:ATP-dependent DNA helicase RecG
MLDKIKQFIRDGEGLTVEFKRCENEISNSIYETISSFSNRYGGYIFLGVEDNGDITGVKPEAVIKIKKDFANSLNNPQRFSPTLFIALEETEINGKIVLWCYVPPGSQMVMFGGRIYDRSADGDMDITRNTAMVAHIAQLKQYGFTERKVFPYVKDEDFDFERLIPLARTLAVNNRPKHPWKNMSDIEIP